MKMISYWKNTVDIYDDDGFVLIIGYYDHKNQYNGGDKELGVHWGTYPQSRGILSPCVIPASTRSAILSGLLHKAVTAGDLKTIYSLTKAIEFFNT
ncbi:hypothetical protein [Lelliottia amnigena]|jgi:hypothetical protein|uniref:hypothetical protein n=1 Tax=Lelliottia amnigena TaxID=61646 RepID=UPI001C5C920B|nr:hypothetical protein [Lelliottia amnigena]MCE9964874.1 hypothetical protein [Lelliottia amnigena]QXZ18031.1 hypothetical protein I6L75_12895 [Lelliottia amnigena]